MDINQLIGNVDNLNLQEIIEDTFYDITKDLVDAQRDQLLHGYLSTGKKTGKYKNNAYALKKYAMNPLAGFKYKDYKLTGELQKDIFVSVATNSLVFGSFDPKFTKVLEENDGDNIMGLNQKSMEKVQPKLQELAIDKIKTQLLK